MMIMNRENAAKAAGTFRSFLDGVRDHSHLRRSGVLLHNPAVDVTAEEETSSTDRHDEEVNEFSHSCRQVRLGSGGGGSGVPGSA